MNNYTSKEELTYEQYKQAVDSTDVAVWQYNIEEDKLIVSSRWREITGYNVNEFKSLFEFIEKKVIEEDRKSAINDLNLCLEGKIPFYHSEYRIITEENKAKWLLFKGKRLKDTEDKKYFLSGLVLDNTKQKNNEIEIRRLAYYDALTGFPNRELFQNNLKDVLEKVVLNNKKGALISIDLDNFKSVNDTLGHDYGDLLLKVFSQLLNICVKDYGKPFRLSGDEFIILIEEFESIEDLKKLCNEIIEYCKKPFEINEKQVYITTSMGISIFPKDSSNIKDLLKFVDLAMYQSKFKGKNMYTFFEKDINESYRRKIIIEQKLKNVINRNELYIVYQPQINVLENRIVGIEALLRWKNEDLGSVSPSEFIPIAERTGIIVEIGNWMLDTVCKKIHEWKEKKYDFNAVSINISPVQIKKTDFMKNILTACEENKIVPESLELEITEETLIEIDKKKIDDLNELIKKGVNIAIDDFGTGYSSLNYLIALPVNTLKIDKSFIDNIVDKKNRDVIQCILNLSKSLKYKVIAEGVEEKEQADFLVNCGCNIIQGYYFSKPVIEKELEEMLRY